MSDLIDEIETYLRTEKLKEPLFSDTEYERIIMSFLTQRGKEGAEAEEIEKVIRHCEEICIGQVLIGMVLGGTLDIGLKDDELVFQLSKEGREYWEREK